jgi:hypothetical protein
VHLRLDAARASSIADAPDMPPRPDAGHADATRPWPSLESGAMLLSPAPTSGPAGRGAAAEMGSLFSFLFRDLIAIYFLFGDSIAFPFRSKVLCLKKIEAGYQTRS